MNSYDVIAGAVKDYWEANYPQDVVAFFQQKYSWDDKWERCEELIECHGSDDYKNMTFLSDFCEGQTEVKDVVIIPLREVTAFYFKRKFENHESEPQTNAGRIRAMTDEELADFMADNADCGVCKEKFGLDYCGSNKKTCNETWFDWLKQGAEEGEG